MSRFRAGDRTVEILGERRHLRLSLSALAEIASELEAAPSEFWDMPVRDWLTLMDGLKSGGFDRAAFEELLKNYPDDGDENEPNG